MSNIVVNLVGKCDVVVCFSSNMELDILLEDVVFKFFFGHPKKLLGILGPSFE